MRLRIIRESLFYAGSTNYLQVKVRARKPLPLERWLAKRGIRIVYSVAWGRNPPSASPYNWFCFVAVELMPDEPQSEAGRLRLKRALVEIAE